MRLDMNTAKLLEDADFAALDNSDPGVMWFFRGEYGDESAEPWCIASSTLLTLMLKDWKQLRAENERLRDFMSQIESICLYSDEGAPFIASVRAAYDDIKTSEEE